MQLKLLLLAVFSIYYTCLFAQDSTSRNINTDAMTYIVTSDSSNYINDSNHTVHTWARAVFQPSALYKSGFDFDSVTTHKRSITIKFVYKLDSLCKVFDVRVKNKNYSGVNYEYAERKMLEALNSIPHIIIFNDIQKPDCSTISNSYINLNLKLY